MSNEETKGKMDDLGILEDSLARSAVKIKLFLPTYTRGAKKKMLEKFIEEVGMASKGQGGDLAERYLRSKKI